MKKDIFSIPNILSFVRILLIPIFVWLYVTAGTSGEYYLAAAVVVASGITDFLDGQIARRCNMITEFGKFLDPLADKLLVTACMMIFVGWGRMPSWLVFIVIAREFAISGLRMVAANNGTVIAAGWSGKIKTSCTMVGLIAMMVLPNFPTLDLIVNIVILVTTVYSGVEYFCKNWACLGLGKKA